MTDLQKAKEYLEPGAIVPVDIPTTALLVNALRQALANDALDKMAENARELGLDYEPAQQEPVAIDRLYIEALIEGLYQNEDPVSIDAAEEFERLLKTPASPPASKPWVGLTRDERMDIINRFAGQDWVYAVEAIEAKLREKNA